MQASEFEAGLRADGYGEIETKRLEPRPANGDHPHHFSVRGLVLDGAFTVTIEGVERCYRPGEVFEVAEGRLHNEAVGPEGAHILVGHKF